MNTKLMYDAVSQKASKHITNYYSTSFSIGIYTLHSSIRNAIYSIYAFVRLADEIVDTFHEYNQKELLLQFKKDTYKAIEEKISLNPILNAFQKVVNEYHIDTSLVEAFFKSMENDLYQNTHNDTSYRKYIYGSAEVVGLMCLRVFVDGNDMEYNFLRRYAQALGAAFQKVNFLRDWHDDYKNLGRVYFPHIHFNDIEASFELIKQDIEKDFQAALYGIKKLNSKAKFGVYVAYVYYRGLFYKILSEHPSELFKKRIRISNFKKIILLIKAFFEYKLNII